VADEIKIDGGVIDNGGDRIREVIHMGKTLGFKFPEWYAILKAATLKMEETFAQRGQTVQLEIELRCQCPKCTKDREDQKRREGFHVVN
jgi:hypothetical protein